MIGPLQRILRFKQKLDSELLKQVPANNQRFTIFTAKSAVGYIRADQWPRSGFRVPPGGAKGDFLDRFFPAGFPGQQIVLPFRGTDPPDMKLDFSAVWTPAALPPANVTLEVKAWLQRGASCDRMWIPIDDADAQRLVSLELNGRLGAHLRIAHPNPLEAGLLPNFDSYLIAGRLIASGYRVDRWFDDWGYNENDEMNVMEGNPTFFPAKNLPRLGKVFVDILQEQLRPMPIGEFRLGVRVR